jgi:hypothetical protein
MDHDARFKLLLKSPVVLRGFFEGFLPEVAGFIDFRVLEFVDKERFTAGWKKRTGDLLVKTRLRGQAAGFLIHLEHQAQPDRDLGQRMLEYFTLDWRDFDLPVYPIAVLSHEGPVDHPPSPVYVDFPNGRVLTFNFDVIDLARMDAAESLTKPNPAVLALRVEEANSSAKSSHPIVLLRSGLGTRVRRERANKFRFSGTIS